MPTGVRSSCASTCRMSLISTGTPKPSVTHSRDTPHFRALRDSAIAASSADRGTTIDITKNETHGLIRAGKTNVPQKRILLVDDYPDALEIWGLYLRSLGYEVETADDGLTAVEMAHSKLPDIIVLDLELPGITGFEAAVRLRHASDTRAIPLIAATGYSHATQ